MAGKGQLNPVAGKIIITVSREKTDICLEAA
jgi:hypothetical protein